MKIFLSAYIFLLTPILAFLIAQGSKFIIKSIKENFAWKNIFSYSDMPSGHTAAVSALLITVAFKQGIYSLNFAIVFVFSTIVIVDALGLRNYLGLLRTENTNLQKIGHTPLQVIIGFLIGFLVSLLTYFYLN